MQPLTVKAREPSLSARGSAHRGEPGVAEIVKSTAADVVHLATAEARLLKLELAEKLRTGVGRTVWVAVGVAPLATGYLCGVAALAAWLTTLVGLPGALGITALSQAALGGVILAAARPRAARGGAVEAFSGAGAPGRSDREGGAGG